MREGVFEYGNYRFHPYAKYNASQYAIDEFLNYDSVDFYNFKYNREDFLKQSPLKNYNVFYCLDTGKCYIPKENGLIEFDEPNIAEYCKSRMMNDYEIIHSFYVGEREIIVGEDKNSEYRYICGYYESNEMFSRVVECQASNDYLEIMQINCDRTKEQVELCKAQEIKGAKLITSDMCNDVIEETNLTKKVVVIKPDTLRREYQNERHQLMYVTGGNGARPNSLGTKVYGYILGNKGKKETYIRRIDIMGIMDKDKLPQWAVNNLSNLKKEIQREER